MRTEGLFIFFSVIADMHINSELKIKKVNVISDIFLPGSVQILNVLDEP